MPKMPARIRGFNFPTACFRITRRGLGFYFSRSHTLSFPRFAWECIPGRFASAFHYKEMAESRTNPLSVHCAFVLHTYPWRCWSVVSAGDTQVCKGNYRQRAMGYVKNVSDVVSRNKNVKSVGLPIQAKAPIQHALVRQRDATLPSERFWS